MLKNNLKRGIYLFLIIIWMITIFMFSNQNGNKSQNTSRNVTRAIVNILTYNQNISEEQKITLIENADYAVRKLAHFSIYAVGGILIYNYINTYNLRTRYKIIVSILIGILYAAFDELHQYFVSDRSARIFDICIDSMGAITGVTIIYLAKNIKNKNLK